MPSFTIATTPTSARTTAARRRGRVSVALMRSARPFSSLRAMPRTTATAQTLVWMPATTSRDRAKMGDGERGPRPLKQTQLLSLSARLLVRVRLRSPLVSLMMVQPRKYFTIATIVLLVALAEPEHDRPAEEATLARAATRDAAKRTNMPYQSPCCSAPATSSASR